MLAYLPTIIGMLLIIEIGVRGRRNFFPTPKKPLVRAMNELSGLDAMFRLAQSALIFIAGEMYSSATLIHDYGRLSWAGRAYQIDKFSMFLAKGRKICRLSRTRPLSQDLYSSFWNLKGETCYLRFAELIFSFMGDVCNVTFFIADAYTNLYMVGALTNTHHQLEIDYWANIIWTLSNILYILRNLVAYYRLTIQKKQTKREIEYLIIDIIRNALDAVLNLSFMMESVMTKKMIGGMGMLASAMWLSDYWRIL